MKHCWILFLALPAFAAKPEKTMLGAKLADAKPPAMTIVVGANAVAGGVAAPGWPIIVSAATDDDKPVPAGLNIKMTDDKDKEVAVTFEPVKNHWIAGEAATTSLKPGRYHITLVPAGDMQIESADLRVEAGDDDSLGLLKIQRALLTGHDDEALAETERHPKSADAWIAKGDILMAKDSPDEALKAYDKAFEMYGPKAGENLPLQERRRAAFFRSLEKRGVLTPAQSP
jgi:hypothetical protein